MKKSLVILSLLTLMSVAVGCTQTNEETPKDKTKTENTVVQEDRKISNKLDMETLYPNEEERAYATQFIGLKAPDFTLTNIKGETKQLSKMTGKNVILEVAVTTCPACAESYPNVNTFKERNKEIEVLPIYPVETKADINDYLKTNNLAKNDSLIPGESLTQIPTDYGIKYTPTFIFIDKEGYIQYTHIGSVSYESLESMSKLAFKLEEPKKVAKERKAIETDKKETTK